MPNGCKPVIFYALATSDACRTINELLNRLAEDREIILPVYVSRKFSGLSFLLLYGSEATVDELTWWLR